MQRHRTDRNKNQEQVRMRIKEVFHLSQDFLVSKPKGSTPKTILGTFSCSHLPSIFVAWIPGLVLPPWKQGMRQVPLLRCGILLPYVGRRQAILVLFQLPKGLPQDCWKREFYLSLFIITYPFYLHHIYIYLLTTYIYMIIFLFQNVSNIVILVFEILDLHILKTHAYTFTHV